MQAELPWEVQPLPHPLALCILLQSFGVSHMKLGAVDPPFRSLTSAQSVVLPQLLGFDKTMLLQLAALGTPFSTNSEKGVNGL